MAGDEVEILPDEIRLTLGVRDVLVLQNRDDVPQIFGPTLMMPGQSFRLPFGLASSYQFACTAHASGQMTIIVDPFPGTPWTRLRWRMRELLKSARAATGQDIDMSRLKQALPSMLVFAFLIALWWGVVVATGSVIFPTPWQVVTGTLELIDDGTLWEHIATSLLRVGAGFLLAVSIAVPLGLWMGWVRGAFNTLNPIFQMLRPISPIAWIPIAILWFGVGNASPVYLIFISSVFPMIVQTTVGVHTIERRYLWAAENFGVSRYTLFSRVVIPAVLPQIIVGMRIGLGVAWLVVVAAEMIALRSGLGYLIIDSRNAGNRYDLVISGMIIIGLIGLSLDGGMRWLEELKSVRWRYAH